MPRTAGALIALMTPGLAALVGALAIALIGGTAWRLTNGKMRSPRAPGAGRAGDGASVPLSRRVLDGAGISADRSAAPAGTSVAADAGAASELSGQGLSGHGLSGHGLSGQGPSGQGALLTSDQLGHALGERATLVQFSSAFCAPCRATRRILADVAGMTEGVAHIEIDAESRLDLVRQLNVLRTPTILVLAGDGRIVRRASGQPRKPDVIAAIGIAAGP
jgi:thiol-disulfide isomerase/thioredoxin